MSIKMSVDKIVEKIFENFKRITPALFAIAILTGLLLFLPDNVLNKMSLNSLPDIWKQLIGIIFLFSIALISTIILSEFFSLFMSRIKKICFQKTQVKKLEKLSQRQKNIILELLKSEDKSIQLDRNSRDTVYLKINRFIYQPEQLTCLGVHNEIILTYVPYPWLLDLYNTHSEYFN